MRATYRYATNKDYWEKRWDSIASDTPMENRDVYPLRYALEAVNGQGGRILEAGCGAGRVLRYFKEKGHDIVGMDFIEVAVNKLKMVDPKLNVMAGDITRLPFPDNTFRTLFAFGLYHNLMGEPLEKSILETRRVLEPGGVVCASFRADNVANWLNDNLTEYRSKKVGKSGGGDRFHKLNLTRKEFVSLFEDVGFSVLDVQYVVNMPIWYKFSFFRKKEHRIFDENAARREGYLMNGLGRFLHGFLMRWFPDNFCNIYVVRAQKTHGSQEVG